jgi:hypothetical protein
LCHTLASLILKPVSRAESLAGRISEPLRGGPLVIATLTVWTAGAAYCHGYERLLSGAGEWPGSFLWSAVAVLPWLGLFEWSKRRSDERLASSAGLLALALVGTGIASMLLEYSTDFLTGSRSAPLGLDLLRRLPAVGASLLAILWAFAARSRNAEEPERPVSATDLIELAPSIDWIATADNYIELHIGGRVILLRMTMRTAERKLEPLGFARIHRRFLVNRRRIERVTGTNGDRRVRIGGTELPVGRSYLPRLES